MKRNNVIRISKLKKISSLYIQGCW